MVSLCFQFLWVSEFGLRILWVYALCVFVCGLVYLWVSLCCNCLLFRVALASLIFVFVSLRNTESLSVLLLCLLMSLVGLYMRILGFGCVCFSHYRFPVFSGFLSSWFPVDLIFWLEFWFSGFLGFWLLVAVCWFTGLLVYWFLVFVVSVCSVCCDLGFAWTTWGSLFAVGLV